MGLLGSYGLILPHDHPCYCYELVTSHRRQTQCKNADSDTGKKKRRKVLGIYLEGDDTFDLKVPWLGERTASEGSSFQSLTVRGKKVLLR